MRSWQDKQSSGSAEPKTSGQKHRNNPNARVLKEIASASQGEQVREIPGVIPRLKEDVEPSTLAKAENDDGIKLPLSPVIGCKYAHDLNPTSILR